ncbi:MAG TPA: nuclear transport factor 2 family protein [Longimicrobiaceae bacterium]|nr:nuclear transport factor 2 family protein [Longimicrobiaceae bacterium]
MPQITLKEVPDVLAPAFAEGDPAHDSRRQEQENVRVLEHLFGLIAAGRFEELPDLFTPEITFELAAPPELSWVREAAGPEAVAAAIAANFRSVREQRPELLSLVAQGDTVMLMGREEGRHARTGEPYRVLVAQQYTFSDGRLAAFRSTACMHP